MTNLNIFQAALSLRTSGQEGLFLEASPSQLVNTYLILHDALHVYLDIPADTTENELQINCAEEVPSIVTGKNHPVLIIQVRSGDYYQ